MEAIRYRYFIQMSFDGTNYFGWQVQDNAPTVQQQVDNALSLLLREQIHTVGAGRTDTGVHARKFIAHFDSAKEPLFMMEMQLQYKMNHILPKDIAVTGLSNVHNDAHARFDAISRTYQYLICTEKDPFMENRAWYIERSLDTDAMQAAADFLLKYSDFSSFSKSNTQTRTNNCKIMHAAVSRSGHIITFEITADRFLRNMVRAITGNLVDIGFGKISIDEFASIIEAKDRCKAGYSAPGRGLYLTDIRYSYI